MTNYHPDATPTLEALGIPAGDFAAVLHGEPWDTLSPLPVHLAWRRYRFEAMLSNWAVNPDRDPYEEAEAWATAAAAGDFAPEDAGFRAFYAALRDDDDLAEYFQALVDTELAPAVEPHPALAFAKLFPELVDSAVSTPAALQALVVRFINNAANRVTYVAEMVRATSTLAGRFDSAWRTRQELALAMALGPGSEDLDNQKQPDLDVPGLGALLGGSGELGPVEVQLSGEPREQPAEMVITVRRRPGAKGAYTVVLKRGFVDEENPNQPPPEELARVPLEAGRHQVTFRLPVEDLHDGQVEVLPA